MQKVLTWQVPNITEITSENVGSILLHVNPRTGTDELAPISDLNKIEVSLSLTRGNMPTTAIFDGYLGDLLQFLHGGTTKHEITTQSDEDFGFMFNLEFAHAFNLGTNDVLTLKTNFGASSSAFTSAVNANSTVVMYTNPSAIPNPNNYVAIYESFKVPNSDVDFERYLGTNVVKIMLHTHPTKSFTEVRTAWVDPLPLTSEIVSDDFTQDKSQIELFVAQKSALAYNPESEPFNLVQYNSTALLSNVRLKLKLDKPATINTKVLVTSYKVA